MSRQHQLLFWLPILLILTGCAPSGNDEASTNQLAGESSPYLRQHARNPVDWHPWRPEALQKAEAENKMLIISIGYAACHWCHVMERESFEDTTVARIMNEHFLSIKVDREERPDVDDVYMSACQLVSKQGCGWPLNVFALPNGQPVWAGTYAPTTQWLETLEYFAGLWKDEPEKLKQYAAFLTRGIQTDARLDPPTAASDFTPSILEEPVATLLEEIDYERGGRQGYPKFPMPSNYDFLLRYHHRTGNGRALEAATVTLDRMAGGGIYDHLGGGFARYATDAAWRVPHFEKMLYDNAQLTGLYARAYQLTGEERYRQVADEILAFIQREMTSPEGAFYSSLDADSEGSEGRFYTWTREEILETLADTALFRLFCRAYGITPAGNWEEGRNILFRAVPTAELAGSFQMTPGKVEEDLTKARSLLFERRSQRSRPGLDNKVITAWNGLMIQGLAAAFKATGTEHYREAGRTNALFLWQVMRGQDNRLRRSYLDGTHSVDGFLDDYAQTILGFIRLYEITFEEEWLYRARQLADYTLAHFRDTTSGLFFYTSDLDPPLVVRKMERQDNVIPSSNSALGRGLFYLGQYFYETSYLDAARKMAHAMQEEMSQTISPDFYTNWYQLWQDLSEPPYEIAIVGPRAGDMRNQIARHYLPNALLLGGTNEGTLELLRNKLLEGQTLIYICQNKICKRPVTDVTEAMAIMR